MFYIRIVRLIPDAENCKKERYFMNTKSMSSVNKNKKIV